MMKETKQPQEKRSTNTGTILSIIGIVFCALSFFSIFTVPIGLIITEANGNYGFLFLSFYILGFVGFFGSLIGFVFFGVSLIFKVSSVTRTTSIVFACLSGFSFIFGLLIFITLILPTSVLQIL